MERVLSFVVTGVLAIPAWSAEGPGSKREPAGDFSIAVFGPDEPPISGAYCEFSDQSGVVLKGDWVNTLWMKLDGQLVAFRGKRSTEEDRADSRNKRWRQMFRAGDATLTLDLVRTREAGDGASMEGTVRLKQGKRTTRLRVQGGCGA